MKEKGILKNLRETYLLAAADLELFPEDSEEYRRAEAEAMNTSRTVFELFGATAAEDLRAAVTEALTGTLRERGRGFASDREAWAELKECVERTKKMHSDIEKVHKEMWSAVTDHNGDAFAALSQEFERSATRLAEEWAQTSALAKIAVLGESANEAVEESGEEVAE